MKKLTWIFLILLCCFGVSLRLAEAVDNTTNWVCQNLTLKGQVSGPLPKGALKDLLLTLSYQLDYNAKPVIFLTNHPLAGSDIQIQITGLRDKGYVGKSLVAKRPETMSSESLESESRNSESRNSESMSSESEKSESQNSAVESSEIYYLPKLFLLPRDIEFQYYVQSADRRWVSELKRSKLATERIEKPEDLACPLELALEPLTLKKRFP